MSEGEFLKNLEEISILTGSAGLGKSKSFRNFAFELKQKSPGSWIQNIDLKTYLNELAEFKREKLNKSQSEQLEFIYKKLLKLGDNLNLEIFKNLTLKGRVVLLFDGFDEISGDYSETVIAIVSALRKVSKDIKLIVSTRPEWKDLLEDRLCTFSFSFHPLTAEQQRNLLLRAWKKDENWTKVAEQVLKLVNESNSGDNKEEFVGNPLIITLIADHFADKLDNIKTCIELNQMENLQKFNLYSLLEHFVDKKFKIYWTEKKKMNPNDPDLAKKVDELVENHQKLAFQVIFPTHINDFFPFFKVTSEKISDYQKIGLIEFESDRPIFFHRTTPEYLVIKFLLKHRREEKLLKFLFKVVLSNPEQFIVIRSLLSSFAKEIFADLSKIVTEIDENDLRATIQLCIKEKNGELFNVIAMCLSKNQFEKTVLRSDKILSEFLKNFNLTEPFLDKMKEKLVIDEFLKYKGTDEIIEQYLIYDFEKGTFNYFGFGVLHYAACQGSNQLVLIKWLIKNYPNNPKFVEEILLRVDLYKNSFLYYSVRYNFCQNSFISTMNELKSYFGKFSGYEKSLENFLLIQNAWAIHFVWKSAKFSARSSAVIEVLGWVKDNFKNNVFYKFITESKNMLFEEVHFKHNPHVLINLQRFHSVLKLIQKKNFSMFSNHRDFWMENLSRYIPNEFTLEDFVNFLCDFDSNELFEETSKIDDRYVQNAFIYMAFCRTKKHDIVKSLMRPSEVPARTFLETITFNYYYNKNPSNFNRCLQMMVPSYVDVLNEILYGHGILSQICYNFPPSSAYSSGNFRGKKCELLNVIKELVTALEKNQSKVFKFDMKKFLTETDKYGRSFVHEFVFYTIDSKISRMIVDFLEFLAGLDDSSILNEILRIVDNEGNNLSGLFIEHFQDKEEILRLIERFGC